MNIDTLNTYCGNKLVLFPYLTHGRLNFHQTACCLYWAVAMPWHSAAPRYAIHRLNSWELVSWVVEVAECAWCKESTDCLVSTNIFTFDLILDKITRRI